MFTSSRNVLVCAFIIRCVHFDMCTVSEKFTKGQNVPMIFVCDLTCHVLKCSVLCQKRSQMAKTFPGFAICDLTCHVLKCSVLCQKRSQMAKTFPGFAICDLTCHVLKCSELCQKRSQMAKTFPEFAVCDLTCHVLKCSVATLSETFTNGQNVPRIASEVFNSANSHCSTIKKT